MQQKESIQVQITTRFDPPCLRYWDRMFKTMALWSRWLPLKERVKSEYRFIQHHLECSYREAKQMAWMTYIESTSGEQNNPFADVHTNFIRNVSDIELPLFLCYLCIGTNIQNGHSEEEAIQLYKKWLDEEPENPIFGEWAVTQELKIVPLQTWLNTRKSKGF